MEISLQNKQETKRITSPSNANVSKENIDSNNLYTIAEERKKYTLDEKHALACPNPDTQSEVRNIKQL